MEITLFLKYLIYESTPNILGAQCKVNLWVLLTPSPELVLEMDNIETEIKVFDTKYETQQSVSPYNSICCQGTVCRRCVLAVLRTSHRHLQRSLVWTGRANGLASQLTGPHTNRLIPMGPH
jgi:hypothetical protein